MEEKYQSTRKFRSLMVGLSLVLVVSSILSMGIFAAVQFLGSSDTLKWFLGPFVGFFFGTFGVLYVVNRIDTRFQS